MEVPKLLEKYKGQEAELYDKIRKKYGCYICGDKHLARDCPVGGPDNPYARAWRRDFASEDGSTW